MNSDDTGCRLRISGILIFCAALLLTAEIRAQSSTHPGPEIQKTEDGIPYVSAGIGYDSRINLPRFSLRLVFSTKSRKYLADIGVEITPGPLGRPTRIHSPGPWLHVDLAPGHYRVRAHTATGEEVERSFEIAKGQVTQLTLSWDISGREN